MSHLEHGLNILSKEKLNSIADGIQNIEKITSHKVHTLQEQVNQLNSKFDTLDGKLDKILQKLTS
jgi:chaperonin cofactor prefoldin